MAGNISEIISQEKMISKNGKKEKLPLKMEILKTGGEPDKVLLKNVVYRTNVLRNHFKHKEHTEKEEFPYTARLYKQSPSGKELCDLPTVKTDWGYKKLFLLPEKITCDVVVNADLKIESVFFRSVWKDEHRTIPFTDWLEKTEEKIQKLKELRKEMEPVQNQLGEISEKHRDIEEELEELRFFELHLG